MVREELDLLTYGRNNAAWAFSRLEKNEVGARMLQWTARVHNRMTLCKMLTNSVQRGHGE
jgi:hypothetical protein